MRDEKGRFVKGHKGYTYWKGKKIKDTRRFNEASVKRWSNPEYREKVKRAHTGENNPVWKGNKVGLKALHIWVNTYKPKSMFCERCGKITEKLDCSSINHTYERDISKWRWLCRECHWVVDGRHKHVVSKR